MEVNVWVNNREKKVKGLTKRTTCHDVITALLYNKTKAEKLSDDYIESYVLIEQWRECERILPRNTRIIKIWRSWHNEQTNVKFILRKKTKEYTPERDKNKITKIKPKEIPERITRKRKSGDKNSRRAHSVERTDQQEHTKWLNKQNNQRISRSNDELLDTGTYDQRAPSIIVPPPASEGLVELVLGQEEQLHKLIETIRQTDLEIEYYETQMHLCRVYANGKDYVQESYLSPNEADNEELSDQFPALLDKYDTSNIKSDIVSGQNDVSGPDINDVNYNNIPETERVHYEKDDYPDSNEMRNMDNGPSIGKGKKRVTFAKHDSLGQRICADSVESLTNVGIEKKNEQIITQPTIYETYNHSSDETRLSLSSHERDNNEPLNRVNSEHRINSNNNIKGILVVKNNNSQYNMVTHQQTIIWDQSCNDTDSSSDTGLSSMQDSEDGGAVHTASVTLV